MAGAFIFPNFNVEATVDGIKLNLDVMYFGGGLRDLSVIEVVIQGGETLVEIRNMISSAISAEATRLGYVLEQNKTIMPSFQKI